MKHSPVAQWWPTFHENRTIGRLNTSWRVLARMSDPAVERLRSDRSSVGYVYELYLLVVATHGHLLDVANAGHVVLVLSN